MPVDHYQEILAVIITVVVLFMALLCVMVLIMFNHQRRKFRYREEKKAMSEAYQKQLLESRLEMQEETFDSISREIHDNVGQLLSLAKVQLNIARQSTHADKDLLEDIKSNVGQAMTDLRDIAKSLSSERLQWISLVQAVSHELQRIGRNGLMQCHLHTEGEENTLPEQRKTIAFRIVQESLQNILKHAQATEIKILFGFAESELRIHIQDNGVGFNTEKGATGGLGLQNIRTRAALMGGLADIQSAAGEGTTIILHVPYN
ncbi:sensor histidine kinase [Sphingobacterium corticibacterium]|uniref:Oxygen sensor histidine kinase NreB n=1 Tax=Sphingobacterium corticibacterium TaxID=2484746 RepID=A0A4Q6XQB6_9SPHI|nr:sensor histidine kinase [Sphingobacterium corticibacterium]RZF62483.1 sensor histidine kinase [Sphingobacterium corticibacterium]